LEVFERQLHEDNGKPARSISIFLISPHSAFIPLSPILFTPIKRIPYNDEGGLNQVDREL
jgi:hypothetical protein